jgi:hypothetical protein
MPSVVYILFFPETVQTALSGADLYYWFALGFGKPDHLFSPFLSFLDVPIMGSFVALTVQRVSYLGPRHEAVVVTVRYKLSDKLVLKYVAIACMQSRYLTRMETRCPDHFQH